MIKGIFHWKALIDSWMKLQGRGDLAETYTLSFIEKMEGGHGKDFFNKIEDTDGSMTFAEKWFKSKQIWTEFYFTEEYVYSLLFGWSRVSRPTYRGLAEYLKGETVVDVGGSIFTAYELIKHGVSEVYITNFGNSPQMKFAKHIIETEGLRNIKLIDGDSIPNGTKMICSEYLEHFRDVDNEVNRLLSFEPPMIFDRSSFCMVAYGHYIPIRIGGVEYSEARSAKRAFVKVMSKNGYNRIRIPIYNRNPSLFIKESHPCITSIFNSL